ncbi:MAG: CPBP family intramembrane metalloprotease [Vicinamibacteria bacterium]|nr:CPBP family intramembrane metalloprotease [Vicinamibacteria bacterium]
MTFGHISPLGWAFVVFVTVIVPWAVLRNRESALLMASIPLDRRFYAMLMPQLFLGSLATLTCFFEGIELFPPRAPSASSWFAGTIFLFAALAVVRPHWRRSIEEREPTWRLFAPTNRRERFMWVILSLSAGIGEELVWRGALPALLATLSGSLIPAIVLSVVSFALAHAIQGLRSVLAIGTIAVAFHAVMFISGSLYVGMVVHFVYDVIAGLTYAKFARDLGLLAPEDRWIRESVG